MFGQSFRRWLSLGDTYKKQWNNYRLQVLYQWDCEPMCLLSAENYAEDKPLSKATIKGMAELSKLVSANEGRQLLADEIESRSRGGQRDGKRSYRRELILSDVTEAIKKVKSKQLKGVTPTVAESQRKRVRELTPNQTSDERSDPMQQDHRMKKQRLISYQPDDDLPGQSSSGSHDRTELDLNGSTLVYQDDDDEFLDDRNTPTPSFQETTLIDEELSIEPDDHATKTLESSALIAALATLESRQMISSDVIFKVLRAYAPPDHFVVDPLFFDQAFQFRSSESRVRNEKLQDVSTVIVPLHHAQQLHWTLVVFKRHETSAQHLDSYPSVKSTIDETLFHQCMKELDKDYQDVTFVADQCPKQSNEYDCGVHVIANALYHMAGIEAPLTHDCVLWRRICRAILSRSVDEVSEDNEPLDMSAYSAEPIWEKVGKGAVLGSPRTRHRLVEQGFRALRSERNRNREEGEGIVGMERLLNKLWTPSDDTRSRLDPEIRGMGENRESLCTPLEGPKGKGKEKEKSSSSSSSSSPPVIHNNNITLPHRHHHHPPNRPLRQHTSSSALERHLHGTNNPKSRRHLDDIRRNSSSAHPDPQQGLGLLAARDTLVRARERCARQQKDLDSEHERWKDATRRWQREIQEEAKWTEGLLAGME